jgi:hypothetical protein
VPPVSGAALESGRGLARWLLGESTAPTRTPVGPRQHGLHGLPAAGSRSARLGLLGVLLGACGWFGVAEPPAVVTAAAPASAAAEPARERLVIHGVGDVNLDGDELPAIAAGEFDEPWSAVGSILGSDDLTIANLECAASALGRPEPKEYNFRCDPAALPAMRAAGVEVVTLANNHSADFGAEALLDGRATVEAAGIRAVGVGADVAEANEPAILEVKGWRIAVLGFGGVVPSTSWLAGPGHPGMASGDDTEAMAAAVAAAAEVADLVVVSIHWGRELAPEPDADDVERAERMVAAGADVIFGHHPHVLQPLRWHDERPVAYSLGNFVWPRRSERTATTALGRVVVDPDGAISACLIPVEIEAPGRPVPVADVPADGCGPYEMPRSDPSQ